MSARTHQLLTIAALLTLSATASAGNYAGNNGIMPGGYSDHSATRVDTEVFGWSEDFDAVAAVATNATRGPRGGVRGKVLMVVWPTSSMRAIENIEINIMTAAELPHDPVGLDEAKSKLMDVDYNLGRMYPMRPKKKKPDGWMNVETLWDPVTSGKTCQPAVGFILEARGQIRYQPHEVIPDIKANCKDLRMSNVKTYWGRPDVAVAMAKFDYSPDDHEMSFRQPVSARWNRARELRILVRTNDPKSSRTDRVTRALAKYGRIRIEGVGRQQKSGVVSTQDLALLANRLGNEIVLPRESGSVEGGADIVVTLGDDDPVRAAASTRYPQLGFR